MMMRTSEPRRAACTNALQIAGCSFTESNTKSNPSEVENTYRRQKKRSRQPDVALAPRHYIAKASVKRREVTNAYQAQ